MAEDKGPGFFKGLLLGAVIGAAIGFFLFAPRGGKGARERLRSKMDEYLERVRAAWGEGKEAAAEAGLDLEARFEQAKKKPD